jgi:hypothetical protein
MNVYESEADYVNERLKQLNVDMNVDVGLFSMKPRGGFTQKFNEQTKVSDGQGRVARFLLVQFTKTGKIFQNDHKICLPNVHKI